MLLWECLKKGNLIKSVDFVTRLSDLQAPNLDPITGIDFNQIRPERSPPKVLSDRLIDTIFIENKGERAGRRVALQFGVPTGLAWIKIF